MNAESTTWPLTYEGRGISAECRPGLVSVVIPTFNRATLLAEALASVRQQDYGPIEIIVVDDGSTDDTRAVVARWASEHEDAGGLVVRYVFQENAGQSAARALGVVESQGEYIQLLDSDDRLHPERLSILVGLARRTPGFQAAVTNLVRIDERDRPIGYNRQPDLTGRDAIGDAIGHCLAPGAGMYSRDFIRQAGLYRTEVRWGEDWEYGIRVATLCSPQRCIFMERPLYLWRQHGGARVTDIGSEARETGMIAPAIRAVVGLKGLTTKHYDLCAMTLVRRILRGRSRNLGLLQHVLQFPGSHATKCKIWALMLFMSTCGRSPTRWLWRRLLILRGRRPLGGEWHDGTPARLASQWNPPDQMG